MHSGISACTSRETFILSLFSEFFLNSIRWRGIIKYNQDIQENMPTLLSNAKNESVGVFNGVKMIVIFLSQAFKDQL